MKKERISKSIESFKKSIGKTLIKFSFPIMLSIASVMPLGCGSDPTPTPIPNENQAPETQITRKYQDNGKVKYTFSGTDSDGSIDYISVNINNQGSLNFSNNSYLDVPIIEGNNTVKAIAYDNEGKKDTTPEIKEFISPTEEEASNIIENALNPNTYNSLEKNILVSLGNSESFNVNALIEKLNGTDSVIDYLGDSSNKELLDLYGIPNLYIDRTSIGEIEKKVLEFQNNDYN